MYVSEYGFKKQNIDNVYYENPSFAHVPLRIEVEKKGSCMSQILKAKY